MAPTHTLQRRHVLAALLWASLPMARATEAVVPTAEWMPVQGSDWKTDKLREADALASQLKTDAFLVVQGGRIVHAHGDIQRPMNLASVRKSVLGLLVGIEVGRGTIDLDQSLEALGIDDRDGLTPAERMATVRNLMLSNSGVYHPAAYETADMKASRPARGSHAPGNFWYYNNWDFNALGTVYERRTGRSVFQGLQQELAVPLQFQDFALRRDTESVRERASEHAAYVMHLSARDLARIGVLAARQGRWRERALVPAEWIAQTTRSHTQRPRAWADYGALWWVPNPSWLRAAGVSAGSFIAQGNGGQYLLVDPAHDLVIVHRIDNSKWRFLRGEVGPQAFGALVGRVMAAAPWKPSTGCNRSTAPEDASSATMK